jgi:hypothetical protein
MEFESWGKIPRIEKLNDLVVITEKIDGTNAQVAFDPEGKMWVGSRNKWIQPEGTTKNCDNYGFAKWCSENEEELRILGPGRHFGEWYGRGIGPHGYSLQERRFALFNTRRWGNEGQVLPACLGVVPTLYIGQAADIKGKVDELMADLKTNGSKAVPGFMHPEGLVVYLPGQDALFKSLLYTARGGAKFNPSPIEFPEAA